MTAHKRILGDYTITTIHSTSGVEGAGNLIVKGNLVVSGNTTVIQSQSIESLDPTILLNASANAKATYSGIEVNRLAGNTVPVLYWSEPTQSWVVGTDRSTPGSYAGILTTNTSSSGTIFSGNTGQIAFYVGDGAQVGPSGPKLTWDGVRLFNVSGDVAALNVVIDNAYALKFTSSTPPVLTDHASFSANIVGNGGTGVYVRNSSSKPAVDELVSKTKAKKFAIIFG